MTTRRTPRRAAACCAALLSAAGLLTAADPAARAEPAGSRLERVADRVHALYREAERATDAHNAAEERVREQQRNVVTVARAITRAQERAEALGAEVGALARAQYRSGGMSPGLRLVLSADPEDYLEGVELAEREARAAARALDGLKAARRDLDRFGEAATDELERLEEARRERSRAGTEVRERLREAERLLAGLRERERARLERLEDEAARRAQAAWLARREEPGAEGPGGAVAADGGASPAGASPVGAAVRYARAQLGKPYRWGAEGPAAFDCSGLTLRAWQAAGLRIPRTSQGQWAGLPRVPQDAMRPGDLIVYFDDASHVGLYIGGGAMIHAPRPGRRVAVAGAGSLPVLGVVRPGG
ncbi:C40 family peptidase [Streptomyces capparidis]